MGILGLLSIQQKQKVPSTEKSMINKEKAGHVFTWFLEDTKMS